MSGHHLTTLSRCHYCQAITWRYYQGAITVRSLLDDIIKVPLLSGRYLMILSRCHYCQVVTWWYYQGAITVRSLLDDIIKVPLLSGRYLMILSRCRYSQAVTWWYYQGTVSQAITWWYYRGAITVRPLLLYKGLKGKASIPTDTLIPKTRRGRNQHSMASQTPIANTDVYKGIFFPQTFLPPDCCQGFECPPRFSDPIRPLLDDIIKVLLQSGCYLTIHTH